MKHSSNPARCEGSTEPGYARVRGLCAAALRAGFEVGLYERADVIRWVELELCECGTPPDALLDLVPLPTNPALVAQGLAVLEPARVLSFDDYLHAAGAMYFEKRLAIADVFALLRQYSNFESDSETALSHFDTAYSLALDGISTRTPEEVEFAFAAFLRETRDSGRAG